MSKWGPYRNSQRITRNPPSSCNWWPFRSVSDWDAPFLFPCHVDWPSAVVADSTSEYNSLDTNKVVVNTCGWHRARSRRNRSYRWVTFLLRQNDRLASRLSHCRAVRVLQRIKNLHRQQVRHPSDLPVMRAGTVTTPCTTSAQRQRVRVQVSFDLRSKQFRN